MITYLATEKYIIIDRMSFNVVIKGPVARAGSILYLFRNKGVNVPNRAAKIMTVNREILIVIGSFGSG